MPDAWLAWEAHAAAAWANFIRTPEFIDEMNRRLEYALCAKRERDQTLADAVEKAVSPVRAETERLMFSIQALQTRVTQLEERVIRLRSLP